MIASALAWPSRFNEHYEGDGEIVFTPVSSAAKVSKRLGLPYRSGRRAHWIKVKNRAAREAEEDWT